jgi:hypothetical protein
MKLLAFCYDTDTKAVLPLRLRDCDSIKKKVDYTKFMASRHRLVVALVGEAPYELKVRPVGDCNVIFLIESQSRRLSVRTA